jgi:hypothetical protein
MLVCGNLSLPSQAAVQPHGIFFWATRMIVYDLWAGSTPATLANAIAATKAAF